MHNDATDTPLEFNDDERILRYLLHNVKGLSAVSGGVLGESLELEYAEAEAEANPDQYSDIA